MAGSNQGVVILGFAAIAIAFGDTRAELDADAVLLAKAKGCANPLMAGFIATLALRGVFGGF